MSDSPDGPVTGVRGNWQMLMFVGVLLGTVIAVVLLGSGEDPGWPVDRAGSGVAMAPMASQDPGGASDFLRDEVETPSKRRPESDGIRGVVTVLGDSTPIVGCSARMTVNTPEGEELAAIQVSVPGPFEVRGWEGSDLVRVVLRGDHVTPTVCWCRRGDADVSLAVRLGGHRIRWRCGSASLPRQSMRVVVRDALDLRREDKSDGAAGFFDSMLAAAGRSIAPLLASEVEGMLAEDGVWDYSIGPLAAGQYLVEWRAGPSVHAALVEVGDGEVNLGLLPFDHGVREVTCVCSATNQLIPAAEATLRVDLWHTGIVFRADQGRLLLPMVDGAGYTIRAAGYLDERVEAASLASVVPLTSCPAKTVVGEPGSYVIFARGRAIRAAQIGPDGQASLQVADDGQLIHYFPENANYEMRRLSDGETAHGRATLRVAVQLGVTPLPRGMLHLSFGSQSVAVGIVNGVATCADLPVGVCEAAIRVGPQVHDNDHEYFMLNRSLLAGANEWSVTLPDERVILDVRRADGTPSTGDLIRVVTQGQSVDGSLAWSIRSQGRTRDARIEFAVLPDSPISIRFGRRELCVVRPGSHLIVLP